MRRLAVQLSVLAVVLLGGLAAGRSPTTIGQAATPMADGQGFAGSWQVTVTPAQGPPELILATLAADGTAVVSPPPVETFPGAAGGVIFPSGGHGAWAATGPDTAIFSYVVLASDGQANPVGGGTVRSTHALGADGRTFGGEYVATVYDPAGTTLATIPGTLQATRIVAEAPGMPTATAAE